MVKRIHNKIGVFLPIRAVLGWICAFYGMPASLDHSAWINYTSGKVLGPPPIQYHFDKNSVLSFWFALSLFCLGFILGYLENKTLSLLIPEGFSDNFTHNRFQNWLRFCQIIAIFGMLANAEQLFLLVVL